MNIEAIQAEITRLQALLAAEAPDAEEVSIDLPEIHAAGRAANYEANDRGLASAKHPTINGDGALGLNHAQQLPEVIADLQALVKGLGPTFKRNAATQYMVDTFKSGWGEYKRFKTTGSASRTLSGHMARIMAEAPGLVKADNCKPQNWVVDLHMLADLS
jgi:hypothetical protein